MTARSRPVRASGRARFRRAPAMTPERVRNDEFWWDLEAARFGAKFDLLGRAHRLGDDVIAAEAEAAPARLSRQVHRRANGVRHGRPKARSQARRSPACSARLA